MKLCGFCGVRKPFSEFYAHPKTADGYFGKCKQCHKTAITENRERKASYYREYDRSRGNRQTLGDLQRYRAANPKKYAAHVAVTNGVRDGKLFKSCCEVCGTDKTVHAHHDDYDKPLAVRWLCSVHHKLWHKFYGAGANAH